jgi:pSer/pThr/pTyr-binding forkhead associated (FHA) protein
LDERLIEDRLSRDESSNKNEGETDALDKSRIRITTQPVLATPTEVVDINIMLDKVPPGTLGLFIINYGDLVSIEKADRVILGRQTEDAGTSVSIDLAPYGGAQSGVSRRHAAILIYQDMHLLQDLGSTNGTWLNAVRLPPHSSHMLKSGDMIQLGHIRIQAVFRDSRHS